MATEANLAFGILTISPDDAVRRAVAFAREDSSGFLVYDLAGIIARESGRLDEVGPWSPLLAGAIAGREISMVGLNEFLGRIEEFAVLLRQVPDTDLHRLPPSDLDSVVSLCQFGARYLRAARITKLAHLYRPKTVPILDTRLAWTYEQGELTTGGIDHVIRQVATEIRKQETALNLVRKEAMSYAPDLGELSLLRLVDVLIWTTYQDTTILASPFWSAHDTAVVPSKKHRVAWWPIA